MLFLLRYSLIAMILLLLLFLRFAAAAARHTLSLAAAGIITPHAV